MDSFVVGKMYRRKNALNGLLSATILWQEPKFDYTIKKVGLIKLTSTFVLLQSYIHSYTENINVIWYKVLTSDGTIGWTNLLHSSWEEIKTS